MVYKANNYRARIKGLLVLVLYLPLWSQGQNVYMIGEHHSFLRNYIPQNKIIDQIPGKKIILFESASDENVVFYLNTRTDSCLFINTINNMQLNFFAKEISYFIINNYYQVYKKNPAALPAFFDINYLPEMKKKEYVEPDKLPEDMRRQYRQYFSEYNVSPKPWDFLVTENLRSPARVALFVSQLKSAPLSDRQKFLVFNFFQQNYLFQVKEIRFGNPARDSCMARQVIMLRELFPDYNIVTINGAFHTSKCEFNLYAMLKSAGVDPIVYNILYDDFEDIMMKKYILDTELIYLKDRKKENMEIIDVRACENCNSDYVIYFLKPETIIDYTHFFGDD